MKSESPPQQVDEQPHIAGVADDAIDAIRDQSMPGLDGYQPAEPPAEHKNRPDPQRAAGGEEEDSKPTNGVPVEGPELLSVGVSRQITRQQRDQREGYEYPAVGAVLAHAGA